MLALSRHSCCDLDGLVSDVQALVSAVDDVVGAKNFPAISKRIDYAQLIAIIHPKPTS